MERKRFIQNSKFIFLVSLSEITMTTNFQLYKSDINGEIQQTANARELHDFLEIKKDFSDWIKAQIERAGFIDGIDFIKIQDVVSPKKGEWQIWCPHSNRILLHTERRERNFDDVEYGQRKRSSLVLHRMRKARQSQTDRSDAT